MLAYCDYIANRIKTSLTGDEDFEGLIEEVGPVKFDLAPAGWMKSTKKTLLMWDKNGKRYRVTVEEDE